MYGFLNKADFSSVIRLTPLVSIDLIIRDPQNKILLGLRNNEPAKGNYFVPGGRVRKNERLKDAFARIILEETDCRKTIQAADFLGVYEHLYENNFLGEASFGTHYVVLAYEVKLDNYPSLRTDPQHNAYDWWEEAALIRSDLVHENTKAYFRESH